MKVLLIAASAALISGCAKLPQCHEPEAVGLVSQIIAEAMDRTQERLANELAHLGVQRFTKEAFSVSVSDVVQKELPNEAYSCTGKVAIKLNNASSELPLDIWKNEKLLYEKVTVMALGLYKDQQQRVDEKKAEPNGGAASTMNALSGGSNAALNDFALLLTDVYDKALAQQLIFENKPDVFNRARLLIAGKYGFLVNAPSPTGVLPLAETLMSSAQRDTFKGFLEDFDSQNLRDGATVEFDLGYNISIRKVDGKSVPYVEPDETAVVSNSLPRFVALNAFHRLYESGMKKRVDIPNLYTTDDALLGLFGPDPKKVEPQVFRGDNTVVCGFDNTPPGERHVYDFSRVHQDLMSGKVTGKDGVIIDKGLPCEPPENLRTLVRDYMIPGVALLKGALNTEEKPKTAPGIAEENTSKEAPATLIAGNAAQATVAPPSIDPKSVVSSPAATAQNSPQVKQEFKPSFSCEKASTYGEKEVCHSSELAQLDVEFAAVFRKASSVSKDLPGLRKWANNWRRNTRDKCSTADCIRDAYQAAIIELSESLETE